MGEGDLVVRKKGENNKKNEDKKITTHTTEVQTARNGLAEKGKK